MPSDPVLVAEGLGKRFKIYPRPTARLAEWCLLGTQKRHHEHWALREVSFSLSPGETFGIMGRNGAGKTTLLALLAGILNPTVGTLTRPAKVAALINLGAGFDPDATGAENARRLTMVLDGVDIGAEGVAGIADFAELGEAMDRPFRTYSAGMQLRLAFACATRQRPDLMIIDEVMAVGDFFFRRKCHARIREFVAAGTAAVLVSHDYTEIVQFCRRALVLERGQVLYAGEAATAVNRYLYQQLSVSETDDVRRAPVTDPQTSQALRPWPANDQQIQPRPSWTLPCVRLTSLACCDSNLGQRWVFAQGEYAAIFVEIEALTNLAVPIITVVLSDDRGVIIHGSSTHMRPGGPTTSLVRSERLRVRCDLAMALRYGEYQLDISISELDPDVHDQRHQMSFEELGAQVRQLGRCAGVGVLAVIPRQGGEPAQLTHHGIADLPGAMTCGRGEPPSSHVSQGH